VRERAIDLFKQGFYRTLNHNGYMSNRPEGQTFRQPDSPRTKPRKPVRDPEAGSDAGSAGEVLTIVILTVFLTAVLLWVTAM